MKKTIVFMTALLVMAMLFASCSNGMGEKADGSGSASAKTVNVSLGVDVEGEYIQKDVSVTDFNLNGLTVWYKAKPQWTQSRTISGDTTGLSGDDFVQIPNFTSGSSVELGYFTAGIWNFYIEVRKNSEVIYEGQEEDWPLYTDHSALEITVAPKTGNGTVTISVQVPSTVDPDDIHDPIDPDVDKESVSMTYVGTGGSDTVTLTKGTTTSGNIRTFTTNNLSLPAGAYTFYFLYTDNKGTQAGQNGGASVAVNVVGGKAANITGLIENGKWHETGMTITVPGVTCAITPNDQPYLAPNTKLTYTCTATSNNLAGLKYAWFVNGVDQNTDDDATAFIFNNSQNAAYGTYEITCVVTDGDARAFARQWVEVTNTVSVTPPENGTVTANKTHATTGEIVTLTVSPEQGYSLEWVKVNGSTTGVYDVVGGKAFHMPAGTAAITASFTQ